MSIGQMFSNLGAGLSGSASRSSEAVGGRVFSNKGRNVHPTSNPPITAAEVLESAKNVAIGNKPMRDETRRVVNETKDQIRSKGASKSDTNKANRIVNMTAAKTYGKNYLTGGDYAGTGIKRASAVTARHAAIGAAIVAPRVLSGGDLTSNNTGERDIAGIPFI